MTDQIYNTQAEGPVEQQIRLKLQALNPVSLRIINDSHRHHGHAGDNGTGESHFTIEIVSEVFRGKARIAQHQLVYSLLNELLSGPVHALALKTTPP